MKKIKTLFKRKFEGGVATALNQVEPECQWVLDGEGTATQKIDGQCVKIDNGLLYKRYDVYNNKKIKKGRKPIPDGFIPVEKEPDPVTGHWPGWLLVDKDDPTNWIIVDAYNSENKIDGTYEVTGPKVGTRFGVNPEKVDKNIMFKHGDIKLDCPRDFDGIRKFLSVNDIEGVVFHHEDGRMCKIKKSDFGLIR